MERKLAFTIQIHFRWILCDTELHPTTFSKGRYPNGVGPFSTLIPTFDQLNTNSVNTGLVLNEFQADNESTVQDQWGGFDDWIELYNNSNQPIDLEGYYLSDKIGDPTQYEFPDTTLLAHEYLIIWCGPRSNGAWFAYFFQIGVTVAMIFCCQTQTPSP